MFRPDLAPARDAAGEVVFRAVRQTLADKQELYVWGGVIAARSFVHGFATLWLNRNLCPQMGDDPDAAARLALATVSRLVTDGAFEPTPSTTPPGKRRR
jgi:hypothetical protein